MVPGDTRYEPSLPTIDARAPPSEPDTATVVNQPHVYLHVQEDFDNPAYLGSPLPSDILTPESLNGWLLNLPPMSTESEHETEMFQHYLQFHHVGCPALTLVEMPKEHHVQEGAWQMQRVSPEDWKSE